MCEPARPAAVVEQLDREDIAKRAETGDASRNNDLTSLHNPDLPGEAFDPYDIGEQAQARYMTDWEKYNKEDFERFNQNTQPGAWQSAARYGWEKEKERRRAALADKFARPGGTPADKTDSYLKATGIKKRTGSTQDSFFDEAGIDPLGG